LPAAIPEGFTGEPTAPGVAPWVDENGLLRQNAQPGALVWPSLWQPDRATNVERANTQRILLVRMSCILRSEQKIEHSEIRIERFSRFDYSFFANLAGYAENSIDQQAAASTLGGSRRKLGRIIDTLAGGSMSESQDSQ
jgi:hypothetical protein